MNVFLSETQVPVQHAALKQSPTVFCFCFLFVFLCFLTSLQEEEEERKKQEVCDMADTFTPFCFDAELVPGKAKHPKIQTLSEFQSPLCPCSLSSIAPSLCLQHVINKFRILVFYLLYRKMYSLKAEAESPSLALVQWLTQSELTILLQSSMVIAWHAPDTDSRSQFCLYAVC